MTPGARSLCVLVCAVAMGGCGSASRARDEGSSGQGAVAGKGMHRGGSGNGGGNASGGSNAGVGAEGGSPTETGGSTGNGGAGGTSEPPDDGGAGGAAASGSGEGGSAGGTGEAGAGGSAGAAGPTDGDYAGVWSGRTEQEQSVEFVIDGVGMVALEYGWVLPLCGSTTALTLGAPALIVNDRVTYTFNAPAGMSTAITVDFQSESVAAGQITFTLRPPPGPPSPVPMCSGTHTADFVAAKTR
jgi:hypothetical protein